MFRFWAIFPLNSYWMTDSKPEEQFSNSGAINKGDKERNSKKGKLVIGGAAKLHLSSIVVVALCLEIF